MYLLQYKSSIEKDTIKCCLYKDPCLEYQTTRKLLEWFGHPFRIDDIRIPRRPWDERLHSMIARLKRGTFSKNTNKHWLVKAESLQNDRNQQKTARFKSWNLTGKLKGYLFQKTKLWEELVALTAKVKKPRSQKKKQEVSKKMVYCVKMSILESFLLIFFLAIILFLLCVSVVWSLNCSVLSSVPNSVFNCVHVFVLAKIMWLEFKNKLYLVILVETGLTSLKCTWTVCRTLSPVLISN